MCRVQACVQWMQYPKAPETRVTWCHTSKDTCHNLACLQVEHRRGGNSNWVPQQLGGLFKKGNALVVEAQASVAEGDVITMDFGALPEARLDSQVLLDYGTMDVDGSQVTCPCTLLRLGSCSPKHPDMQTEPDAKQRAAPGGLGGKWSLLMIFVQPLLPSSPPSASPVSFSVQRSGPYLLFRLDFGVVSSMLGLLNTHSHTCRQCRQRSAMENII